MTILVAPGRRHATSGWWTCMSRARWTRSTVTCCATRTRPRCGRAGCGSWPCRTATQRVRDRGGAGLTPPCRKRSLGGDASVQPSPQLDRQLAIVVRLARRRRRCPPREVCDQDVRGEFVDETHRPDEQRPEHFLRDPGGGVLARVGGGLAPAVEVLGVEAQRAGRQGVSPQPELAYPRAGALPGTRRRERAAQIPLEVLEVDTGQGIQPRDAIGCPA